MAQELVKQDILVLQVQLINHWRYGLNIQALQHLVHYMVVDLIMRMINLVGVEALSHIQLI